MFAEFDESCEGGFALGGLFAFTAASRQFDAGMMDGAFKDSVVVGSRGGYDMIAGRL